MSAPLAPVLPEGGFPQGRVVELASPANLGQVWSLALRSCAAAQEATPCGVGERRMVRLSPILITRFSGPRFRPAGSTLDRLLVLTPPRHSALESRSYASPFRASSRSSWSTLPRCPGRASSSTHRFESMDAWAKAAPRLASRSRKLRPPSFFLPARRLIARLRSRWRCASSSKTRSPSPLVRVAKEKFGRITSPAPHRLDDARRFAPFLRREAMPSWG